MLAKNNLEICDAGTNLVRAGGEGCLNPALPTRLRLARWLGHQRWIARGHVAMVRLLCPPETAPDFDFSVDFYGLRYAGNLQNVLDWSVFFFGAHAKSELEVMAVAAACLRSTGRPVVYVDVGANVGQHLLFMSLQAVRAYGFEPWEPVLERARAALALNHIENAKLFPIALGEARASRRFYPPSTSNHGSGSFVEDWFGLNDREGAPVFLEVWNGDEFLKSAEIGDVGILKIDVEGSEASVCRGLRETILRDRPFILMEVSGHAARDFGSERGLRNCFYEGAHFYRLSGGRHRTHLRPYRFHDSLADDTADVAEIMIVPAEHRENLLSRLGKHASGRRIWTNEPAPTLTS